MSSQLLIQNVKVHGDIIYTLYYLICTGVKLFNTSLPAEAKLPTEGTCM
jgi:hypothetical protein